MGPKKEKKEEEEEHEEADEDEEKEGKDELVKLLPKSYNTKRGYELLLDCPRRLLNFNQLKSDMSASSNPHIT